MVATCLVCQASGEEKLKHCAAGVDALVVDITGTCSLQPEAPSEQQMLSSPNALGKVLHAGEQLQCNLGGSVVLLLCGSGAKKTVTTNPPDWYTVLNVPSFLLEEDRPAGRRAEQIQQVLQLIHTSVDSLCAKVETRKFVDNSILSEDALATANSVTAAFVRLGILGTERVTTSLYRDALQRALLDTLKSTRDCRQHNNSRQWPLYSM
jgi:hypothetical protein